MYLRASHIALTNENDLRMGYKLRQIAPYALLVNALEIWARRYAKSSYLNRLFVFEQMTIEGGCPLIDQSTNLD